MRPLSLGSETRLSLSFLRTMPARKPRTECDCQPVADIMPEIVAPAGARSISTIRPALVPSRAVERDDAGVEGCAGACRRRSMRGLAAVLDFFANLLFSLALELLLG